MKPVTIRSMLYGLLTIISAGLFGGLSEICDYGESELVGLSCGSRSHSIIAFAVLACAAALLLFIGTLIKLKPITYCEMALVPLMFAFWTVCVAIGTSARSGISGILVHLAWWGELLSFVLVFMVFFSEEIPTFKISAKKGNKADIETGDQPPVVTGEPPHEPSTTTDSSAKAAPPAEQS